MTSALTLTFRLLSSRGTVNRQERFIPAEEAEPFEWRGMLFFTHRSPYHPGVLVYGASEATTGFSVTLEGYLEVPGGWHATPEAAKEAAVQILAARGENAVRKAIAGARKQSPKLAFESAMVVGGAK